MKTTDLRAAIVIGATSGIGRELARLLASQGRKVGVTGRRTELLETLRAENPELYEPAAFDAAADDAPGHLERLWEKLGKVGLVVICAGTGEINHRLEQAPELRTVALNVVGFTRIIDMVYNRFAAQGGGHLAAVSSVMGLRGADLAPAYAASKAYQINYLEGLRKRSVKNRANIVVTDLRPGSVDTAMMQGEGHFWIASPQDAARCALRAINKRKAIQYVTPRWRMIGILLRSLPRALYYKL
ncbi:SDR family NAD(P)-dependent oxidoreductase [uncultured Alistipes sp.]|jgi:short-chain dehydrogenases of various substrate specificities|uniref:SDR family NAD(P)-dependent oxidoreductase n=1 Tax=uncultured Alistipes sp. TaxID=538949 RepID=UPI0025F4EB1F|nr:SDR family NAD(P)-dependent oxidoreductase [uncultured Alistipes sp.]